MKTFMGKNFLLNNETAKILYHTYAAKLPIIDYHCHVPPKDIAEDKQYTNLTELWLGGDHYKWRAIRSAGIDEKYITGDASDYEKFRAYASVMPSLIGNPLYHWTHLELKRFFDCDLILGPDTCDEIWELTTKMLASPDMSVRNLIKKSHVDILCTTDDPADSLEYHKILAADDSFETAVYPAFRPDKCFNINKPGLRAYYDKLGAAAGVEIQDVATLKQALKNRIEYFASLGCRTADHGLDEYPMFVAPNPYAVEKAMETALQSDGADVTPEMLSVFKTGMLQFLAAEYARHGWVMQFHMGVYRNANTNMYRKLGPDTGFDTIGNNDIAAIVALLDSMESGDGLPRTILYSIDPTQNAAIGSMIGCFQTSGDGFPKVMQGSAWWFNDTIDGMRAQMKQLANLSVFGKFLGMLTDSRSFTSYPRHEYFRRILCSVIGEWVEEGLYPDDWETLAQLVCDICYNNTKNFFGFQIAEK
ncbi:MAG: glucuronate isomerase [Eubacteriales bacterium]|nr:glucuronate isomerase [Clostridiales bacterium]MDD7775012.1 glucuronate isomerase [Eubacteriales bacterium]MDY3940397.1 glucuronate isomerase [Eubacteriales bacterium]